LSIQPYIYTTNQTGETVAHPNPAYDEHERKQRYKFFLERSGIPKEYQKYHWSNVRGIPEKTLIECKQWAEAFNESGETSLYIQGNRTIGKTTLACVIGMTVLKKGCNVKFIKAYDLQDMFLKMQGYSNRDDSVEEIREKFNKLMVSDLIIVDDALDRSKSVYWKNSPELIIAEWNSFIRERVQSEKRMVFTSNVSIAALRTSWGDDIYEMLSTRRGKFREVCYDNPELTEIRKEKVK
jgi:DNA replication protein DnaC